jgi:hypothetical protein
MKALKSSMIAHPFLIQAAVFSRALVIRYGTKASPVTSIFAKNAKKGDFVETLGCGV